MIIGRYSHSIHGDMEKFIRELRCVANIVKVLGQSGSLSPYCDMSSMYFDDSMYESKMHYKIAKLLDEYPLMDDNGEPYEELRIDASSSEEYNGILDKLANAGKDLIVTSGIPNNPTEIIVEKDPRDSYRQFDESMLMESREENNGESSNKN